MYDGHSGKSWYCQMCEGHLGKAWYCQIWDRHYGKSWVTRLCDRHFPSPSCSLFFLPPSTLPPSTLFIFSTKIQNFTRFSSFSAFPRICFKKSFLLVLTIKWGQESATWTTAKCSFEEGIFRNTSRQIFLRLVLFQVMHSGSRVFGWLNMTAIILGSALVLALPLSRKSLTRIFVTYFQRA